MTPKFRAWNGRFSEFLQDFFVGSDGKVYKKSKETEREIAIPLKLNDKVILMQSTSLRDKVGKEIFEFDVVTTSLNEKNYKGVVKLMNGSWLIDTGSESIDLWSGIDKSLVVGNIYENPELLPE